MKEDVRLELFSVAELRDWLLHNVSVRGLSEKLMSKTRAYSIVNNPYARDDMYVISAIFVGDEVAAYTAVFPEKLARPDRFVYWDTTLYVAPQYEGRGYAAIVIGQICELYGADYFDHGAAVASVQNFKFLGIPVSRVPQYLLGPKAFAKTMMGALLRRIWDVKDLINGIQLRKKYNESRSLNYVIDYVNFVDDATYRFIEEHSQGDVFLRTKDTFNWMLRYPFVVESPLVARTIPENSFSAYIESYAMGAAKVVVDGKIVGFYIIVVGGDQLIVKYLYYNPAFANEVFGSIFEHVYKLNIKKLVTYSLELADYLISLRFFHRKTKYGASFTHPEDLDFDGSLTLQAGDGDLFSL